MFFIALPGYSQNYTQNYKQDEKVKSDYYQIGPDERLLITVHILGEVGKPGEYLVPDDTNLLELISKAGGPTEFSNLSNVKITRGIIGSTTINSSAYNARARQSTSEQKKVIEVNLKNILTKEGYNERLPILNPGDIVQIGRNTWYRWQSTIRFFSQVAIIVQAMYWYSHINQ